MASVPNLPIAPAVPVLGAPGAAGEGAPLDIFAQLLTGGPAMAVVAGPGGLSPEEVSLRAAPAEGEAQDGEAGAAGDAPADIIPLLQAQSGFPVAVVPAAPAPSTPERQAPAGTPDGATSGMKPEAGTPASQASPVAQAVRTTIRAALEARGSDQDGDAIPGGLGDAVKAAIRPLAGKSSAQDGEAHRAEPAPLPAGKPGAAPTESGPRGEADTAGEAVARQLGPAVPNLPTAPTAPAFPTNSPTPQPVAATAASNAAPDVAELVIDRQLDLAGDDQWLDRLARDIARTVAGGEPLRFRLNPQTLGHLQVELSQSDRGATVRLTVETEAARNILVDAQPRLAAEARAQGVRLAGTEVDLGSAGQQGEDARRNAETRPQDMVRVVRATSSSSTSPEPAAGRSDRYA